ncbi:adhesion G-protein coupled receptor G2-like [Centropristis striata]|uniref:adhesion G-protein coupled receptor G2-like n=1 Tax=Centropristis striata TaxID=184440 RepID=UPI0027E05E24|nr:adhesion G-protein coupled receptor G2-like [Centropristis striata]
MVPLLLLLLLPGLLAEQVCFQISDYTTINNMTDTIISDNTTRYVDCRYADGLPCLIECTLSNITQFTGSICLKADKKIKGSVVEYNMEPYTTCTVYLCNETKIVELMKSLETEESEQMQLSRLLHIKKSCPHLFQVSYVVKASYISVEKHMIHNIMGKAPLETQSSITYKMKDLSLNVINITETDLSSTDPIIKIEAPQLLPQNTSFIPEIWLPTFDLQNIPMEKRVIGLVSYMEQSQFQFEQENISSMILRIEVLDGQPLRNLKTPIEMTFRIFDTYTNSTPRLQCRYFDEHDSSQLSWKKDGCVTNYTQTDIICSCNHATPFAVLLIAETEIPEVHWEILSYISYIGCGLSAFFTALSIVVYVFNRNHKMDYSISIHVCLSGALFLLNTTFLLTEWGANMDPDWVCVFVAALMHYSLLSCFTWMAIEALHLYLLLIKVFNTYFKHYLVKLSLAGWGIPGIIVGVSLAVKDFKQFYGVKQMNMANSNQTSAICWITDDSFFYSVNLVYFTLIFIFNTGILVVVSSNICKMKQVFRNTSTLGAEAEGNPRINSEMASESCKSGFTVMGLTCLMGTTWGLAFLGSGYVNLPILYLFCILNSTQGFFIFLWISLSVKRQRQREMEDRMSSSGVKTSGVKFD